MRHIKSERLKKLETELQDLEQWLKLGLVPKKDIEKHKEEIKAVQTKIEEEKERLQFLILMWVKVPLALMTQDSVARQRSLKSKPQDIKIKTRRAKKLQQKITV